MLKFLEGFELSSQLDWFKRKWAQAVGGSVNGTGRLQGQSLAFSLSSPVDWRTRSLGLQNTWTIAFGLQFNAGTVIDSTNTFPLVVKRGVTEQLRVQFRKGTGNTFKLDVFSGATLLGSTADYVPLSWHFFEIQITINTGTSGSVQIRHNTQVDLTVSSVDTAASGQAGADVFEILGDLNALRMDDLHILDNQGSLNTTYLGDSVIEGRQPSSDGTPKEWSLENDGNTSLTDHWQVLNELTVGGSVDNQYIYSATVGQRDILQFPNLSLISGQIHGVMVSSDARLSTTGTRQFRHIVKSGGTTYETPTGGISHTVASTSYQTFYDIFEVDPDTGSAWTLAALNAAGSGPKVIA